MTIYSKPNYRKIYEQFYGPIPKDENGKSFHVHHIDGDRTNNSPENLIAVNIQDHYNIHYSQGDWGACFKLARLMNMSATDMTELAKRSNQKQLENKTHPFLDGEKTRQRNLKRVKDGNHQWMKRSDGTSFTSDLVKNGTHHFLGGEVQRQRAKEGKHNFQDKEWIAHNIKRQFSEGKHPSQVQWLCEHCGKSGNGSTNYKRWHGVNCRQK